MSDLPRIVPHVINLDRTPERLAAFRADNPELSFERFAAIEGKRRTREDWIADGLIDPSSTYNLGACGSAASHTSLWRQSVESGEPRHIIEDDVILRADFAAMAARLLGALRNWDLVCWTWNFNWPLRYRPADGLDWAYLQLDPMLVKSSYAAFKAHTATPMLVRIDSGATFGCYSVSPAGAAKLLDRCLPAGHSMPILEIGNLALTWENTALDVEGARHYRAINAFATIPPLAVPINDPATSTLLGGRLGQPAHSTRVNTPP